jgi:hypothetical protein
MKIINLMQNIRLALALGFVALASLSAQSVLAGDDNREPDLPPACSTIQVPAGNKVSFHVYALGVQVYRWNGVKWDFVAPIAKLFADPNYHGLVGSHFAGPTWMSNSGSSVKAARVDGCSPEPNAIPWLLLKATPLEDNGIFGRTTFIHRVNTSAGLEPSGPGPSVGFEVKVPYTAEYYFYRADN